MLAEAAKAIADTGQIVAALKRAADVTGSNFDYLLATAKRESGLKNTVQSKTSSATGLFQFIDQTWLGLVKNHGAKYGLGSMANAISKGADGKFRTENPADRQAILALRTDPQISALMAGEFTKGCQNTLEGALGRDVSTGELYAAHFLGADAACKLIKLKDVNPTASAVGAFAGAAAANKSVFYNKDGSEKTVAQVYNWAMKHAGAAPAAAYIPAVEKAVPALRQAITVATPTVSHETLQDTTLISDFANWKPRGGFFSTGGGSDFPAAPLLLTPGIFDVLSGASLNEDADKKAS
jgi:hypothetical protein